MKYDNKERIAAKLEAKTNEVYEVCKKYHEASTWDEFRVALDIACIKPAKNAHVLTLGVLPQHQHAGI